MTPPASRHRADRFDVAIVGMSGRFPGAPDIDAFWQNLRAGVESRTVFSDEEILAQGMPAAALRNPKYIRSGFVLDGIDLFDAAFFGINPREAELLDPQHRVFLECAWEALEHAGYDAQTFSGSIGVFGGATLSSYLTTNVLRNSEVLQNVGGRQAVFGSVPDYMVTRVAYKLNLQGPAYFVQSACSTSLVAVHLACQSLANHECDMVLAGGVSIGVPDRLGYTYEEGGMLSPDGIVRTFDANARGTIFGCGVGMVVLKRLADAINDGDTIHAVVKGVAANNDGSLKVGFTAPGVVGQSRVISEALGAAGVPAETISYVEAHGTGTELGDPIEIAALTRAYRASTDKRQFCAIGSVKPNIGHLDAAAGVSSLIKTVLALKHRQIPPTINFERPNPKIEFENSPFFVNTVLTDWPTTNGTPRRAGVSSFGFGGTNAHVIVEEAPEPGSAPPSRAQQLLVLAARTEPALERATNRLAESLQQRAPPIADVAHTLAVGRRHFIHRRAVVCANGQDAAEILQGRDPRRLFTGVAASKDRPVVFMFPGQGSQYVNMGVDLYRDEPLFRDVVDECAEGLRSSLGVDLRHLLYPAADDETAAAERLTQTIITQSALFTTEYALARLVMLWGLKPEAMIGHSIGELVAACVAGVFSLKDALELVALRGTLMEAMPPGAMAAVPLAADEVTRSLGPGLWLAAANAPSLCVVSGELDALDGYIQARAREGVECRRLLTSHAFHSALMDGAVAAFTEAVRRVERHAPAIRFVSNVTGAWITDAEAVNPQYWGGHIRQPVRFSDGVTKLLADSERLLLEVGPGNTLSALVRQQRSGGGHLVVASLRHPQERASDLSTVLSALGRLWVSGAAVDWQGFYAGQQRRRVPLPSYPFERQKFWIAPEKFSAKKTLLGVGMMQPKDFSSWFHVVSWKLSASQTSALRESDEPCLVFEDHGCSARIAVRLAAAGRQVLRVHPGDHFEKVADDVWTVAAGSREDHVALLSSLHRAGTLPGIIVHAWGLTGTADAAPDDAAIARAQDRGFYSLLSLAQALGEIGGSAPVQLGVITDGVHEVIGGEAVAPEKATVLGPCRVIPQEFPNISCRHVDLSTADSTRLTDGQLDAIITDLISGRTGPMIAYRQGKRWTQTCDIARLEPCADTPHPRLRPGGVYLITGGFGGIGQVLAEHLAESFQARLVLTGRRGLPPRAEWAAILDGAADGATRRRIQAVHKLEKLGAEVFVGEADVTDEARMRAVVADARARFGRIDGVIHSAGIAGGGMIQLKKKDVAAAVLAPKVIGARILARLFDDQPLDFLLLCSSLTALVGGVGQVDYCAANSYLDAFARQFHVRTGTFAVAVNWNAWREVGMAVDTNVPEDLRDSLKGAMLSTGITNEQGLDAFRRILARCADRQIAISPNDLGLLATAMTLAEDQELTVAESPSGRDERPSATAKTAPTTYHTRPALQTPYVAPRSETEQRICGVWQDLLGIDRVGVNDNFFELGGHSLLAIRVMGRVNETLKTDIPVARLYDGLTAAFLASVAGTNGHPETEPEVEDEDGAQRRRDRARRQREQQARRRAAVQEIAST
jgi:acyl transferase domain-containing protein